MKIAILANRDIASNFAINLMYPQLAAHDVCLFLSSKVGGNDDRPQALKTLRFFEQDLFNELLSSILPIPGKRKSEFRSFEQFDEVLCRPVEELNSINSESGLALIEKLAPDLIISIRYGVILKDEAIAIPKLGVINLHSGLLPGYRGVMATFWALLNGESEIGTTLHFIDDSQIDAGKTIAFSKLSVNREKSYLWHVLQLYIGGCELVLEAVAKLAGQQEIATFVQNNAGNYFTFPELADLEEFEDLGLHLVDEREMIEFFKHYYF